jgi:S-formylglutathione hydrolase FrmB
MEQVTVHSDVLSAFWKQPITLHADVLLPDSYDADPTRRYPVIYWFFGYGGNYDRLARAAWGAWTRAFASTNHDAIVVFPDPMLQYAYTEFANSANTGPWGDAFAYELVPYIDRSFRTAKRYVAGHSSGAWAAIWQQINHPELFDGAWAYAPDPLDFRDFTGPNLTATPPENLYVDSRGQRYTFVRKNGHDTETLEDFVVGAGVGPAQFASFEAVFSPQAADGLPAQLFDRKSGAIDATVAAYWESHYDATALFRREWAQKGPALRGKLHVIVGTADTFHLDGPTRLFCDSLAALGADAACTFLSGEDHFAILGWDGGYERHVIDEIFRTVAG